jgi:hypothetical protein
MKPWMCGKIPWLPVRENAERASTLATKSKLYAGMGVENWLQGDYQFIGRESNQNNLWAR